MFLATQLLLNTVELEYSGGCRSNIVAENEVVILVGILIYNAFSELVPLSVEL